MAIRLLIFLLGFLPVTGVASTNNAQFLGNWEGKRPDTYFRFRFVETNSTLSGFCSTTLHSDELRQWSLVEMSSSGKTIRGFLVPPSKSLSAISYYFTLTVTAPDIGHVRVEFADAAVAADLHRTSKNVDKAPPEASIPGWKHVNVQGSLKWFTLEELSREASKFLLESESTLDLNKYEITANLDNASTNLVFFTYFENFGLPSYRVVVDKSGRATSVKKTIASEKVD